MDRLLADARRITPIGPDGGLPLPRDPELLAALRLASTLAGGPRAVITLADGSRLHELTSARDEWGSAPRHVDASRTPGDHAHPRADGGPGPVALHAGVPLVRGGVPIGDLCVVDDRPGRLTPAQLTALDDVAALVCAVLDRRWAVDEALASHAATSRAHEELAAAQAFTDALLEALPVGVVAADAQRRVTLFNRVSRAWHGQDTDTAVAPDELSGAYDLFEADGRTPLAVDRIPLLRTYREGRVTDAEIVIHPHQQEPRTVSCSGAQIRDADGTLVGAVVAMADVTAHHAMREQLRHAALHDPLTGLPNRTLLLDRLHQALASTGRDGLEVAVLHGDLDGFKAVNDTCGHDVGDEVIREVATRLRAAVRPGDTVARVGGDEFVVVCRSVDGERTAEQVRDRIGEVLRPDVVTSAGRHRIGISLGLAMSSGTPGVRAQELVTAADRDMYRVKRTRRAA